MNRLYYLFVLTSLLLVAVLVRLVDIQFSEGDTYRSLSEQLTLRNDTIFANRGNIFSADGSLLATSIAQYEIRMDAFTVAPELFQEQLRPLSVELSAMLGNTPAYWETKIRRARKNKNRYLLIAKKIGHNDYVKMKQFPIFKRGMYRGGFIAEQSTERAHPLGKVAERTIGYDNEKGSPGIEGAYKHILRGKYGWRMKQKMAKNQWKPINDSNEKEPQDGKDVITTIDINIQDIAHHSLLRQLEYYQADHGCVVVMETRTGEIKAIANLGRTPKGKYYEKRNYAVYESQEPGSAFKLMSLVAALEARVIDTGTMVDTGEGRYRMYGRYIHDAKRGGYGEISAARALELSSNIGFARLIDSHFSKDPQQFIALLKKMHIDKKIGLPILGEGSPELPAPGDRKWSKNALPSMAYGYNLRMTPLQTLVFYNAIANGGTMVKPRFVKAIKFRNKTLETFERAVIDTLICSTETIQKVQEVLQNVVVRGTAKKLYSSDFSMAGKTGTARTEYWLPDWDKNRRYVSSFTGYFPAENPQYSCVVVIHKPQVQKGYYGADVSGPVFKDIAQKIYTARRTIHKVVADPGLFEPVQAQYEAYNDFITDPIAAVPNLRGMPLMDAIPLLENAGLKVRYKGQGKVVRQSISAGDKIVAGSIIHLTLG
ncbi:MAG: penicillin-binding protein [Lutibacter sp.]|nr:penicillin-binding protein [Lutibacter sp.]